MRCFFLHTPVFIQHVPFSVNVMMAIENYRNTAKKFHNNSIHLLRQGPSQSVLFAVSFISSQLSNGLQETRNSEQDLWRLLRPEWDPNLPLQVSNRVIFLSPISDSLFSGAQGMPCNGICVVMEGRVSAVDLTCLGSTEYRILGPGEWFGLDCCTDFRTACESIIISREICVRF